jgi:hypothetical protein
MDFAVAAGPAHYKEVIDGNKAAHADSGHVPTASRTSRFSGHNRTKFLIRCMESKGLTRRSAG